jgi:hypothetical protein
MVSKYGMTTTEARALIEQHVLAGSNVNTDSAHEFRTLAEAYVHGVVNHEAREWARGSVTTNAIENFWSLLKRTIRGTYICPAPFHTFRYLDEQAFRFNERSMTDADRFRTVLGSVARKRLTYAALTAAGTDRRCA